MIEGRDLYGDGVNIAARLEALAEPSGICISRTVLSHARDKVSFDVEDAGEQTLKNIARPVPFIRSSFPASGPRRANLRCRRSHCPTNRPSPFCHSPI